MKNGFYMELDSLRLEDAEASFGFLENISVSEDMNAFNYLHGFCADFAAMLSDLYGYEIICVRHYDEDDVTGKLIHAYCIAEFESEQVFIDVRGITNDPVLFFEEFEHEMMYYPKDNELWALEGPAIVEKWSNKDALFDGDYEGWKDDKLCEFIRMNADYYSPKAIQKLLDGPADSFKTFPPYRVGDLYHVGTMDISKKSRFSHEGDGLSVSNCPDAWVAITKGFTHGDCFKLTKEGLKLLDYYALTQGEKEQIQQWAIDCGYVKEGTLYKALSWDEDGEECFSLYDSYGKALYEACDDPECVEPVEGLLPTQALVDLTFTKFDLLHIMDTITALYADRVLNYDGIYWNEVLDVSAYSAPRGVIFNSKVSSFYVVNLTQIKEKKNSLQVQIESAKNRTPQPGITGTSLVHER